VKPGLQVVPDARALARRAAERIVEPTRAPRTAISWYFGDERAVPSDYPESNCRAAC
jgi:6-phosphogluconolactonase/glucosamine-6-phosphate isomerase/deaminase